MPKTSDPNKPKKRKSAQPTQPESSPVDTSILDTPQEPTQLALKPDALRLASIVYQVWQRWANFELTIVSPSLPNFDPPHILKPESLPNNEGVEFVYIIHDYGNKFITSKQEELFSAGLSMCKLHYTIEKIIALLVARLDQGGVDKETEVQIAFAGHESAQRKGFESVINLKENVIVINFEPGVWGERYLNLVKKWADRGFGYPKEAPRDVYRISHGISTPKL